MDQAEERSPTDESHGLMLMIIAMPVMMIGISHVGKLSDRIVRKPLLLTGFIIFFALSLPAYLLIGVGNYATVFSGLAILGGLLLLFVGVFPSVLPALFRPVSDTAAWQWDTTSRSKSSAAPRPDPDDSRKFHGQQSGGPDIHDDCRSRRHRRGSDDPENSPQTTRRISTRCVHRRRSASDDPPAWTEENADRRYPGGMRKPRIVVVGSINMDLTTSVSRFPAPGETLLGTAFATSAGGKGSNQAISAAKAGGDVTFIGAVGDDGFGSQLLGTLREAGVDTSLLRTVDGASGIAAITVDSNAENSIIVVAGANASVTELTEADLDAIAGADVLLCQLEIPLPTVTVAARHARANDTTVVLNPSPVQELPEKLISAVDVLIVNQTESEQLGSITDRVPYLVTTLGADGADLRDHAGTVHADSPMVTPVDTTGAGDAFAGAFAVEWVLDHQRALPFAAAAGSLATTVHGAAASSPRRSDTETVLANINASRRAQGAPVNRTG